MSNLRKDGQLRWAPSYLRNRGQMTRAQKRAMRESWPIYGIRFQHDEILDLDACFVSKGPLVIEIGFGMGDHLVSLAKANPDYRVLGLEVHRPGLAAAAAKAAQNECHNVRLIRGDARLILSDHLAGSIASAVLVQFPDPWPKEGDEHRRLIQPDILNLLDQTLVSGGECCITTDVVSYANHCREVFSESEKWIEIENPRFRHERAATLYERKAIEAGRDITELCYETV